MPEITQILDSMRYIIGIKGVWLYAPNKKLYIDSEASEEKSEKIAPELLRIYSSALTVALHLEYTLEYMVIEGTHEKLILMPISNEKSRKGLIGFWVYQRVSVTELFPLLKEHFEKLKNIIADEKSLTLESNLNTMSQTVLGFQSSSLSFQQINKTPPILDLIEDFRRYLNVGTEFVSLGALDYLLYLNASYSDKKSQAINQIVLLMGIMCSNLLSSRFNANLDEPVEIHLKFQNRDLFYQAINNNQGWIVVILRTGSHKLELLKMWIQANATRIRESISVPTETWARQKHQIINQLNALKKLLE